MIFSKIRFELGTEVATEQNKREAAKRVKPHPHKKRAVVYGLLDAAEETMGNEQVTKPAKRQETKERNWTEYSSAARKKQASQM